jgi:hypothetical protein
VVMYTRSAPFGYGVHILLASRLSPRGVGTWQLLSV